MIYLDNAASTPVLPAALSAAMPFLTDNCGNPSSIHTEGRKSALAIISAREKCADAIGAKPSEIIFTSGGTESDNLAIISAARLGAERGKRRIITTAIEHPAVINTCKSLEKQGFEIIYLPPDKDGLIKADDVASALTPDTALVSVMTANNEIGTIQPIAAIGDICRKNSVLFHTDAVQAIGAVDIDVSAMNIDLLSCSAHKLGGFKGSGFLYCRDSLPISPIIFGGGQENGMRSGTENVAGIVALGFAIEHSCKALTDKAKKISVMRDELISMLLKIPDSRLNGSPTQRLCGNVNISFGDIEGESLVLNLDLAGICCSSGSACAGHSTEPSHVLKALKISENYQRGSLRLTLSEHTTFNEIRITADETAKAVHRLRKLVKPQE